MRACEHRRYARPLLISSYISRCCPTRRCQRGGLMMQRVIYLGRGAALPAWGVGLLGQIDLASRRCSAARMGGGTCLVTRHFCAKLAVQAFCSSPPGGIPLSSPLAPSWRLFRRSWLAMPSRAGRFAPFRCAHPGRRQPSRLLCAARVAPGGMTTAGDLFKFKTILFL